jgi:signal transduction histidine kinase
MLAAILGVMAFAGLLVSSSALFAQSDQTVRAIAKAREAQLAEELLTATTATRASLALTLLIAESGTDPGSRELAASAADLIALTAELDVRAGAVSEFGGRLAPLSPAVAAVVEQIQAGAREEARDVVETEVLPAIDRMEAEAILVRDEALRLLAAEDGTAGTMARAASIAVALIVPGVALVSLRTIQHRRQRQRDLELRLEHETDRSRIKDEMIANLSHELRTPLTAIYGMALTMAEDGFADPDLIREGTDIIVGEAADLSRMVDDLLVAAKVEAGDIAVLPVPVDPIGLIDEVLVPFGRSRMIARRSDEGPVLADPLRLKQVVRNLVSNAIKHGGKRIAVVGRAQGSDFVIAVTDDGDGVPPELEPRLFDRFIHEGSAPLTSGSVGLGLAIAHELVRRMGGDLRYDHSADRTTFSVTLPLALERQPAVVAT